jgi:hypothetical protein
LILARAKEDLIAKANVPKGNYNIGAVVSGVNREGETDYYILFVVGQRSLTSPWKDFLEQTKPLSIHGR